MSVKSVVDIMSRYCARCGNGIYTTWRTLDNKRFYHPHCFTCAICGILLEEMVEEGEVATLKEVYCPRCYQQTFKEEEDENFRNPYHDQPTEINNNNFQDSISTNEGRKSSDVNLLFSSHTYDTLHIHQRCFQQHHGTLSGGEGCQYQYPSANPIPFQQFCPSPSSTSSSVFEDNISVYSYPEQQDNYYGTGNPIQYQEESNVPKAFLNMVKRNLSSNNVRKLERQHSRIPRPTSSLSRKSITSCTTDSSKPATSKSTGLTSIKSKSGNVNRNSTNSRSLTTTTTTATTAKSSAALKMQRSVSVVQTKSSRLKTQTNGESSGNGKKAQNGAKKTIRGRPRNELEASLLVPPPPPPKPSPKPSKRQCAAKFLMTKGNKRLSKSGGSVTPSPKESEIIPAPTLPSILSVIGRSHSNTSPRDINRQRSFTCSVNQPMTVAAPKLSFNVTFDCPICISSLVQGANDQLKFFKSVSGNGNVVTACGHLFHRDCLENWLNIQGNKRCPICASLCVRETLQPVYLECNVSADPMANQTPDSGRNGTIKAYDSALASLRTDYNLLLEKYNNILAEKNNYSLKVTIANSLQNAYDMECRNRLKLQWENKKLIRQLEEIQRNSTTTITYSQDPIHQN